ncbi:MAG: AAA family ATPase [Candidatus Cybelea sp.]|jgi:hypothetical protein
MHIDERPTELKLSGWRQFDGVEIEFHPRLTVLTGANGAGKTTILNILAINLGWKVPFASVPAPARAAAEFVANIWHGIADLLGSSSAPTVSVGSIRYSSGLITRILVPLNPPAHRYDITFDKAATVAGLYIPSHRPVYLPVDATKPRAAIDATTAFDRYSSAIRSAWVDTLPSTSSPIRILKETLLSWPGDLKFGASAFEEFSQTLEAILPSLLKFKRLEVRGNDVMLVCESGEFTLDSVSGGIAAIIDMSWQTFLYSKLAVAKSGFIVLIDEPENHLHPEMQRSVLFKFKEHFENAQFIIASHAPLVVTSVRDAAVYALVFGEPDPKLREAEPGSDRAQADASAAEYVVNCLRLEEFDRSGTASDILMKVLGLDYTIPVWAANILEQAVADVSRRNFEAEALQNMKATLAENNLSKYLPEALSRVTQVGLDDSGARAST